MTILLELIIGFIIYYLIGLYITAIIMAMDKEYDSYVDVSWLEILSVSIISPVALYPFIFLLIGFICKMLIKIPARIINYMLREWEIPL